MLARGQQTAAAMKLRSLLFGLMAVAAIANAGEPVAPAGARALAFRIDEGRNINSFLRDGPGRRAPAAALGNRAAHSRRISRRQQRRGSVVRKDQRKPVAWTLVYATQASHERSTKSAGHCDGIEFEIETDAPELRPRAAVLSSVRVLRDYELQGKAPAEVMVDTARHRRTRSPGSEIVSMAPRDSGSSIEPRERRRRCPPSVSSPRRASRCACGSRRSPAKRRSCR